MRRSTLLLAYLCGCVGCGANGEGPAPRGAERFDGHWQAGSATYVMPGGTMTLTRTSTPMSLRGDYTFTATDATHGRLRGRLVVLENDQLQHLSPMDGTVTIDGDDWIVKAGSTTDVFACALVGETLTLTFDPADPRNVSPDDPPRVMVLSRTPPPPSTAVGKWTMLEIDFETMRLPGDRCFVLPGNTSIEVQLTFEVDSRLLMERVATLAVFSDTACTRLKETKVLRADGFLEERATSLEVWARWDDDRPLHTTWDVTRPSEGRVRLTRTCPAPPCDDEPSRLLLEKTD